MTLFSCPHLGKEVEPTEEREQHIAQRHPDLLPEYRQQIAQTLLGPDQVRRSSHFRNARLFTRWFDTVKRGKYVVVVVITDSGVSERHWIVTAYIARRLAEGDVEWQRN
jgi:hypothetical protein